MKCLLKYQWVKLPRSQMPAGKGVMGAWARLASRAASATGRLATVAISIKLPLAPGQEASWGSRASWASKTEARPWK